MDNYTTIIICLYKQQTTQQHIFDEMNIVFPYDQNHFVLKNKQNVWKIKQMMFKWSLKAERYALTKKTQQSNQPCYNFYS